MAMEGIVQVKLLEILSLLRKSANFPVYICTDAFTCIFKANIFSPTLDYDECADEDQNECDPNALCTNTEGSYVCRCLRGYEGDGRNCTGNYMYSFDEQG